MPPLRRWLALLIIAALPVRAADAPKALPVSSASHPSSAQATSAALPEVSFDYHAEGRAHKVTVTIGPTLVRVDEPPDGYSFLYNPATQVYTGLEHRNFTYWEFSWPEVRNSVQNSKRGEKRLQDLANEGLNGDTPPPSAPAPAVPDTASLGVGDSSGYVWRPGTEKKRIAGLDCLRWTGETLSGENCEAWCYAAPLPRLTNALTQLRTVGEPMALVPVRTVVPDFIFVVYDALLKAGVTPVMMTWGSGSEKGMFRLTEDRTRPFDSRLFTVPKLYMKTTLVTMDGMTDQQPYPALRGSAKPPRVDHLTPPTPPVPGQ